MMEAGAMISHQPSCPPETEYDLVGDIVNVSVLYCVRATFTFSNMMLQLIPIKIPDGTDDAEVIDLKYLPYINICGVAESVDDLMGTFNLTPHQYVAVLRNLPGLHTTSIEGSPALSSTRRFKSVLPVKCLIPDSPRWKTKSGKKTTPKAGGYVSVTGFITERIGAPQAREGFCVTIESMVFLGRPIVMSSTRDPVTGG